MMKAELILKEKIKYKILKSCFIGKQGGTVELNARQAANLIAGGYIEPAQASAKKGEVK